MGNEKLIKSIKQIKSVRPSEDWRISVRNDILAIAHDYSKANAALEPKRLSGFADIFSVPVFRPVFVAMAIVLALVAGTAVLSPETETAGKVAMNTLVPEKEVEAVEIPVVEKSIVGEKIDMLQYDYENEKQEQGEADKDSPLVLADAADEDKDIDVDREAAKASEEEVRLVGIAPVASSADSLKPQEVFEADFSVGLKKERSYRDQVIGGFLMAGDTE